MSEWAMCLLTVFPMPDLMSNAMEERLYNGTGLNPHGHGWAVVSQGKVLTGKSMDAGMAIESFMAAYRDADGPAMFHSRWATHGAKDLKNTHPFPVRKLADTYMAHNGIMPMESLPGKGDSRSDTRKFADDILPIRFRQLDSAKVRYSLEKWLGGNKIAVLTTNPKLRRNLYLFGQDLGEWVDGAWFSNSDHEGYGRWMAKYEDEDMYSASELDSYETDDENECIWCHRPTVNAWATCDACGTCQDCFEPGAVCQCYTPAGERKTLFRV